MKKHDAVIAGYLCLDLIPEFIQDAGQSSIDQTALLEPGRLIEIEGMRFTPGGVVANTGVAMKKFGKDIFLNAWIGDDFIGKSAYNSLESCGLNWGIQTVEHAGTAFGLVISPPGIDRIFLESPGCSKYFDFKAINMEAIAQSRLFHFGYPPLLRQFYLDEGRQLHQLFSSVQEKGVISSLDFSLPDVGSESGRVDWAGILERVLPHTDIFVPSLEEALQVLKPKVYQELQKRSAGQDILDIIDFDLIRSLGTQLLSLGARIVLIKSGHRGAYLCTADAGPVFQKLDYADFKHWNHVEYWCEAYPVDETRIRNASGAGDTAVAAFLTAVLDIEGPEAALKYAAMAGRNNLYCYDLFCELDDWQVMQKAIRATPTKIVDLKMEDKDA